MYQYDEYQALLYIVVFLHDIILPMTCSTWSNTFTARPTAPAMRSARPQLVTSSHCRLGNIDVEPHGRFSDHSLVVCQLPCAAQCASTAEKLVRGWRCVNRSELKRQSKTVSCVSHGPMTLTLMAMSTTCSRATTLCCGILLIV